MDILLIVGALLLLIWNSVSCRQMYKQGHYGVSLLNWIAVSMIFYMVVDRLFWC